MAFPITASLRMACSADDTSAGEALLDFSSTAEQKSCQTLKLTGSGSKVVDFGTVADGAKLLAISLKAGAGVEPISCSFNGGDAAGEVEVSPGGFLCLASAVPVDGVVSLTVNHTTAATVRVWIFG